MVVFVLWLRYLFEFVCDPVAIYEIKHFPVEFAAQNI